MAFKTSIVNNSGSGVRHNTNREEQLQVSKNRIKTTLFCLFLFICVLDNEAYSPKDQKPSLNYTDGCSSNSAANLACFDSSV